MVTVLNYGFRPLFLCVAVSALVMVAWWLTFWLGYLPAPGVGISPIAWHGHEMIFGFVGAAIGGFLLTAVANWTRRPPVSGLKLGVLVLAWVLARVSLLYVENLNVWLLVMLDLSYWLILTTYMAIEVIAARNYRNLKVVVILAAFTLLNILFHADRALGTSLGSEELAIRVAIVLVSLLISVIGGRIIPAFTANWLRRKFGGKTPLPGSFNRFDAVTVTFLAIAGGGWAVWPDEVVTGVLMLVSGAMNLARVFRWHGHRTIEDPLVVVLHVGFAWLGIGFMLLGLSGFTSLPASAGVHALGIGAMAGLIVAVSSRAAMGHTGRDLVAGKLLSFAFVLLNIAAILRVIAVEVGDLLAISGIAWLVAFMAYTLWATPILLGPESKN